jgi:hypothetical protein
MALINTTTTGVLGSTFFGDGTGPLTVQQNGVTLGVYGKIPAFSAYLSTNQTLTSASWTKLQFNTELFDTENCYDSTTNYRFTPNIAGYYQVNLGSYGGSGAVQAFGNSIYKNGSAASYQTQYLQSLSYGDDLSVCTSKLFYMNGTTDYIEAYGIVVDASAGTDLHSGGLGYSWFDSYLVKAV